MFSAELGDYDEEVHNPSLISEFRFVPNQNEEFEIDVVEAYKKNRLVLTFDVAACCSPPHKPCRHYPPGFIEYVAYIFSYRSHPLALTIPHSLLDMFPCSIVVYEFS